MQKVWVPSLVRELGSHINLRQKQYCNKSKKDFKNGPHQEKKKIFQKKQKQKPCLFRQCFQNSVKCLLENIFLDPASGVWLSTWDSLHQILYSCSSQVHLLVLLPNPPLPKDINHVLFILEASALRIWTSAYQMQCLYLLSKRTNKCQPQVTLELRFENMGQI